MNSPYLKPPKTAAASSGTGLPTPSGADRLLVAAGSPVDWTQKTPDETKAVLDVRLDDIADSDTLATKSDLASVQGGTTVIQNATPVGTYLVNGVSVVWVSGYTYRIGACAKYFIDGVECSSIEQEVTAPESDETYDRIDVLALNAAGEVVIIPGTPAENPSKPEVDPTLYAEFSFIYVAALSVAPEVDRDIIYQEGTEWTCTASAATIVKDSTNNPRAGSKCIEGTNVVKGQYITAVSAVSFNPATSNLFVFYIRLKAAWASTKSIRLTWMSGTTMIGTRVIVGNGKYGFNTSLIDAYQQIVLPMSVFNLPAGTTVDRIRFESVGNGTNVGFYLDDWMLQEGVAPVEEIPPPLAVRGVWVATSLYARFDIVSRLGGSYISLASNQGKAPESNPSYWFQFGITDIPASTAENDFLVGDGDEYDPGWEKKTLAQTRAILGISEAAAVPIGHLSGLIVSRKDDDEVYVSGGSIEVGEVLFNSDEQFAISLTEPSGYGIDQCTGGTATDKDHLVSNMSAVQAFDDTNPFSMWHMGDFPNVVDNWIQYQFTSAKRIQKITILAPIVGEFGNPPTKQPFKSWVLKASNTGAFAGEEVTIYTVTNGATYAASETKTFTFTNENSYLYYRVIATEMAAGTNYYVIPEMEMMEATYTLLATTSYYIYVDPPTTGVELAVTNLLLSPTAPTFDNAKGGYYHPTNTDQRAIAHFTTDGDGHIPTDILMYLPVPLDITGKMDDVATTAENDFLVGDGDEYDPGWQKKTLAEAKTILGIDAKADKVATSPDPDGYLAEFDSSGNIVKSTKQAADILAAAVIPIGHLSGLIVSRKDDDEIYVSGGSVEVGEVLLNSDSNLAVTIATGEPTSYVDAATGGTASASVVVNEKEASFAFDTDPESYWCSDYSTGQWIQYHFTSAKRIQRITLDAMYNDTLPTQFRLLGSNTGAFAGEEVTIYTSAAGITAARHEVKTFSFDYTSSYEYVRLVNIGNARQLHISKIELMVAIYEFTALTPYYVYVDPPGSGTEILTDNIILSSTAPSFDSAKGGYYHPTNTDQRAIAYFVTDSEGYVPYDIHPYPVVGPKEKKTMIVMILDKDVAIASGDNLGNVQIPIPKSWAGSKVISDTEVRISPLGTTSSSGDITFNLVRTRPPDVWDEYEPDEYEDVTISSPAIMTITAGRKVSTSAPIDTDHDDLQYGDYLSLSCESAGTGAKGPLMLTIVAQ